MIIGQYNSDKPTLIIILYGKSIIDYNNKLSIKKIMSIVKLEYCY